MSNGSVDGKLPQRGLHIQRYDNSLPTTVEPDKKKPVNTIYNGRPIQLISDPNFPPQNIRSFTLQSADHDDSSMTIESADGNNQTVSVTKNDDSPNDTDDAADTGKKRKWWLFIIHTVGNLGTGGGLVLAATLVTPAAPALLLLGPMVATLMIVLHDAQKGDPADAAQEFMIRCKDADSYDEAIKGYKTKAGNADPTNLKSVLKATDYNPSKTLKELDESYQELKKITDSGLRDSSLRTPPNDDDWKIKGSDLAKEKERIEKLKLSDAEKTKLKSKGLSDVSVDPDKSQIQHYETYWKNFLLLKLAASYPQPQQSQFFKQKRSATT